MFIDRVCRYICAIIFIGATFSFHSFTYGEGLQRSGYVRLGGGGANVIEPFSSNTGISDDVNLYTGDVQFGLNLFNLSGPAGLDVALGMSYSSNVKHIIDADNDKNQASWVGLGWTLEFPAIIADLKGSIDISDDDYFYFDPNEGSTLLLPSSGTNNEYILENYRHWKIKRILTENNKYVVGWKIIKEDGSIYKFGDEIDPEIPPTPTALEYNSTRVTIGRGNSILTINSSDYLYSEILYPLPINIAYRWDLKSIKKGDFCQGEITISYNQQRPIGYVNDYQGEVRHLLRFTRCSHPDTITDELGRKIVFFSGNRHPDEILKKLFGTISMRYDSLYLDSIVVYGCNEQKLGKYDFEYTLIKPYADYQYDIKRYLKQISYYTPENRSNPNVKFDYYLDYDSDLHYGALKSILYPSGSYVEYEYGALKDDFLIPQELTYSKTCTTDTYIINGGTSANLCLYNDLSTRQYQHVYGSTFHRVSSNLWNGRWENKRHFDGAHKFWGVIAGNNSYIYKKYEQYSNDDIDIHICDRVNDRWVDNFIGTTPYSITRDREFYACGIDAYLFFDRDERDFYCANKINGQWQLSEEPLLHITWLHSEDIKVFSGSDYFLVVLEIEDDFWNDSIIWAIKWRHDTNTWQVDEIVNYPNSDHNDLNRYKLADDYFVIHIPYDYDQSILKAFFWTGTDWQLAEIDGIYDMPAYARISVEKNFFAITVYDQYFADDDYRRQSLRVFEWNYSPDGNYIDQYYLEDNIYPPTSSYDDFKGCSVVSGPDWIAYTYPEEGVNPENFVIKIKKRYGMAGLIDWHFQPWYVSDLHFSLRKNYFLKNGGDNYFILYSYFGNKAYVFFDLHGAPWGETEAFGSWNWCDDSDNNVHFNASNSSYGASITNTGDWRIRNGIHYSFFVKGYLDPQLDPGKKEDLWIKSKTNSRYSESCPEAYAYNQTFVNSELILDYTYCVDNHDTLRFLGEYDFRPEADTFLTYIRDYPVHKKKVKTIYDDDVTSSEWEYTFYYGIADKSGYTARYNKAIVNGPGPHGYVEHYFFNDLFSEDNEIYSDANDDGSDFIDTTGMGFGNARMLDGMEYKTYLRDQDSLIIDSTLYFYKFLNPPILDENAYPSAYTIRLDSTLHYADNITSLKKQEYSNNNGMVNKTVEFFNNTGDTWKESKITFNTYVADTSYYVFDDMKQNNMLSQLVKSDIIYDNGATQEILRSTKYNWSRVIPGPVPIHRYYIKSSESLISEDEWLTTSTVDYVDDFGQVIQTHDVLGVPTVYFPDKVRLSTIGTFANAELTDVFIDDFIDYCNNDCEDWQLNEYWQVIPGWEPEFFVQPPGGDYTYDYGCDPPDDGLYIHGDFLDGLTCDLWAVWSSVHGGGDPLPLSHEYTREGDYILRFDYRVEDGDFNVTVGENDYYPINWTASEDGILDGRWHTAFVEGHWEPGVYPLLSIDININSDNSYFWIDNIAFFPKDCQASTKIFNYNKGIVRAETDENGYTVRHKYDDFNRLVSSTNFDREYIYDKDYFYLREMELIPEYTNYDKHPNFIMSTEHVNGNLLLNSNFENDLGKYGFKYWEISEGFRVCYYYEHDYGAQNWNYTYMGAKGCAFRVEQFNEARRIKQRIPLGLLKGSTQYIISLFIHSIVLDWPPAHELQTSIEIVWYDRYGSIIDIHLENIPDPLPNGSYQELYVTSPLGSRGCDFSLVVEDPNPQEPNNIYLFFDQINFSESSEYLPARRVLEFNDGVGNLLQTLIPFEQTNSEFEYKPHDIITAYVYNEIFKVERKYKTYSCKQSCYGIPRFHQYDFEFYVHVNSYYGDYGPGPDCGGYAYTEYFYSPDPKFGIDSTFAPGLEFRNPNDPMAKPVRFEQGTNDTEVNGYPYNYPANTLLKEKIINEDGLIAVTFKNTLGHVVETTVDSIPSGEKLTTRYQTNIVGEVSKVIPAKGVALGTDDFSKITTYNKLGQVLSDSTCDGGKTFYIYDDNGNLRFTQNSNQRNQVPKRWTETQYDQLGRKLAQGEIEYDGIPDPDDILFQPLNPNNSGELILRYYYDYIDHPIDHPEWNPKENPRVRGKLVATDNGVSPPENGGIEKYFVYDKYGKLMCAESVIDGLEKKFVFLAYDKAGKLKTQYYPNPDYSSDPLLILKYEYDDLGRLINISDEQHNHQLASYEYLADGSIIRCELGQVDDGGQFNPVQIVDYKYNPRGWITNINRLADDDPTDLFGERIGYNDHGESNNFAYENDTWHAKYNGNPTWVEYVDNSGHNEFPTTGYLLNYDNTNRLIEARYGEYDDVDRLWNVDPKSESVEFTYDKNSNIQTQTRYHPTADIYEYKTYNYIYPQQSPYSNKLDFLDVNYDFQSSGNYQYDDLGNCLFDEWRDQSSYSYNWRNAMNYAEWIESDNNPKLTFTYDSSGKRVKKKLFTDYTCDVDFWCEENYNYSCSPDPIDCDFIPGDVNGDDICDRDDVDFLIDYLTSVGPSVEAPNPLFRGDVNCDKSVDWLDVQLLKKYLDNGRPEPKCCYWECLDNFTFYIYSQGKVAVEFFKNSNTTNSISYVYGPSGIVAAYIDSSGPYFYLTDHLGSTRMVIDTMRNVLSDIMYLPSGDKPNEITNIENLETPRKFTGKELDDEGSFQLYYFGSRYFDPLTCRWKQIDPAGQFASPYSYVGGNVMIMRDPNGEFAFLVPMLMFGAFQAAITEGDFNQKLSAFGLGCLSVAVGGPNAISNWMYGRGIKMLARDENLRRALDIGQTAMNIASVGITGYNLMGKGLKAVGAKSIPKIDLSPRLSAAVTMRALAPALGPLEYAISNGKYKGLDMRIKEKYKNQLDFWHKRPVQLNEQREKWDWDNLGNVFFHALGSYAYYNIASGGAAGDFGASNQTMMDYYYMFESTFEPGEAWSAQDYTADLIGAGIGVAFGGYIGGRINPGSWASEAVDWLY